MAIAELILLLFLPSFAMIQTWQITKSGKTRETIQELKEKFAKSMNGKKSWKIHLEKRRIWLSEHGVNYMLKREVNPFTYQLCTLSFGIFGFVILFSVWGFHLTPVGIILSIAGFLGGYAAMDKVIELSDRSDNKAMLSDIKSVYDTLRIQSKAGVFMTQSLSNSYIFVKNKRLKTALYELSADLSIQKNPVLALQDLSTKFKNKYVDTLVITLEQSFKKGQSVQMLMDISRQMEDVERAIFAREKAKSEMKMLGFQMAVYIGILAVVMFALMGEFKNIFSMM